MDRDLAEFVNSLVSDGIVAAGYTEEALQLLKKKKKVEDESLLHFSPLTFC